MPKWVKAVILGVGIATAYALKMFFGIPTNECIGYFIKQELSLLTAEDPITVEPDQETKELENTD